MSPPGFWKNVMTVLAGASAAQAPPLLVAPLLTRLCTPEEMGAFSVWLGVIAVTSIVATLRIDTVVAWAATALALALTLAAAAARLLDLPAVQAMSWLELLTIGVGTWLTATMQTTLAYAASHRLFSKAAQAKMMQAATIALSQVGLLYAGVDGAALLSGQLIGLAAGLWAARKLLAPPMPQPALKLNHEQRHYLVKHQAFWRFSLPSSLINTLVGQLPLFMIGLRHGALAAGLFALTQRVIAAPVTLVAASVLEVFKRQAVQEFQALGNCRRVYLATFRALVLLALFPSLLLFLFAPPLFSLVFGAEWRPAGEFARVLAPLCFFNFIASPLSYVFFIAGKQKMELRWQIALFLMTLAVFSAPLPLCQSVLWYAAGRSALYVVYLIMSYQCSLNGSGHRLVPAAFAERTGASSAENR